MISTYQAVLSMVIEQSCIAANQERIEAMAMGMLSMILGTVCILGPSFLYIMREM